MEFYKRFLLGILFFGATLTLCYGFWHFNLGMFDNIIFSGSNKKTPKEVTIKKVKNPLELKFRIKKNIAQETTSENKNGLSGEVDEEEANTEKIFFTEVPFTPQAPFADWGNQVYQDGCEEAASLMAVYWGRGKELTKFEANRKIVDMANWQKKNYGSFIDTSAKDTAQRLIKEYFKYDNVYYLKNISLSSIVSELAKGNVIIVPTNGRLLGNPYYTPPGPERHNLLIVGYDRVTDEFITNDPGTKRGKGYRYKASILYKAIRDYATGDHMEISGVRKNMIVVSK